MAAAIAVPLLIAVAVSADLEGSQHTPPRVGSPALPAIGTDARAVATKSACQPDRFCLARLANMSGGLYQSASDDANLTDDTFYYFTDPTSNERLPRVGSHTWSAWNRGRRDVIVYDRPASTGAAACVRAGRKINLPVDWRDRIASFRFATHNLCARYDEPADATG
jgi:hypothetical protein